MTSADQALRLVLENVTTLGVERVPILDALGRVIAEEIRSPRDIPGFDNSAMDGYAVRAADVARASASRPARLRMLGTVAAGAMPAARVEAGTAMRTMTGAPVAEGADAIVPVEQTRADGDTVEILSAAEPHAFVRPRGEDLREGELVMEPGKRLGAADLGMLDSPVRIPDLLLDRRIGAVRGRARLVRRAGRRIPFGRFPAIWIRGAARSEGRRQPDRSEERPE